MGAAASIELLYRDALQWFKTYVDTETYIDDFNTIDKDADGSVSYIELTSWIKAKSQTDAGFKIFVSNPQVVSIAHKNASRRAGNSAEKIVTLTEFRVLLIQLFATSVLWSHFYNADTWADGEDVGNKQLNLDEFKLACKTLCSTHAGEELSETQIVEDFLTLDTNNSDSIGFVEVCNFCYKYIDTAILPPKEQATVDPLLEIVNDLRDGDEYLSLEEKNATAMSALNNKLAHELNVAIDIRDHSVKSPTKPLSPRFEAAEGIKEVTETTTES